jgi:hypothetical protein
MVLQLTKDCVSGTYEHLHTANDQHDKLLNVVFGLQEAAAAGIATWLAHRVRRRVHIYIQNHP